MAEHCPANRPPSSVPRPRSSSLDANGRAAPRAPGSPIHQAARCPDAICRHEEGGTPVSCGDLWRRAKDGAQWLAEHGHGARQASASTPRAALPVQGRRRARPDAQARYPGLLRPAHASWLRHHGVRRLDVHDRHRRAARRLQRGPGVMLGYYRDPEKMAQALLAGGSRRRRTRTRPSSPSSKPCRARRSTACG